MGRFVASKFDPETDPDRPVAGQTMRCDGRWAVVRRVDWLPLSHFFDGGQRPALDGCDEVLMKPHVSRPAVFWACWVDWMTDDQIHEMYRDRARRGAAANRRAIEAGTAMPNAERGRLGGAKTARLAALGRAAEAQEREAREGGESVPV